jgi:hypothetical protein
MQRLLAVTALAAWSVLSAQADLVLQPTDRVALCGDGLPDNGAGVYLEEYLMLAQPTLRTMDVRQFAWVTGDLAAKFDADVMPFKPSVVVLSSGYGADPATAAKTLTDLVGELRKDNVRLVVIGSPPATDAFAYPNDGPDRPVAENQRRAAVATIDQQVAAQEGAVYADVFDATKAAIAHAKAAHADYARQPGWGDAYQLAIASAYVKALGCQGDIGSVAVDYGANTGQGSDGHQVGPMEDHKFTVQSTKYAFWFPGHGVGGTEPPPWAALNYLPFTEELNRYTLTVTHLPTAMTKVYWGDMNYDLPSPTLAKGVNLASLDPQWIPFSGIDGNIDNGVRAQQETDRNIGNAVNQGHPDPDADAKHAAALKVLRDRIVPFPVKWSVQPLAPVAAQPPGPIPVILDTDLDGDVDDVGALALLNNFMDQGECSLLAVVHNGGNTTQSSCATIEAIDTWYGHPHLPIGQYLGEHPASITSKVAPAPSGPAAYHDPMTLSGSSYTEKIRQQFEPNFPDDDKMPAGVDVYRKALASAADGSVVICSVGLMENVQDLLLSQPDSVSPLSGPELIRKKVRQLVIMANTQPADQYLLSQWPTQIIWTTYVGSYIGTGPSLIPTPDNNPVRVAYDLFGVLHNGRQSWDLTAAWLAVRGPGGLFDLIAGRPQYINDITKTPAAPHPDEFEATVRMPYAEAAKAIGEELARPPKQ